jgi:hypothetical protein
VYVDLREREREKRVKEKNKENRINMRNMKSFCKIKKKKKLATYLSLLPFWGGRIAENPEKQRNQSRQSRSKF